MLRHWEPLDYGDMCDVVLSVGYVGRVRLTETYTTVIVNIRLLTWYKSQGDEPSKERERPEHVNRLPHVETRG